MLQALHHLPQRSKPISKIPCLALWVVVLSFILYIATLSRNFTGASLGFVTGIEKDNWTAMLQSHKILVQPLGWGFYHLWRLAGWQGSGLFPLQIYNALAGALCVGLIYLIGKRLAGSPVIGLVVASGFAVSSGIWLFSTQAEFVTPPLCGMLAVLGWLLKAGDKSSHRPRFAFILGLGVSFCILHYITGVFLIPIVMVGLLLIESQTWQNRFRQVFYFLSVVTPIVGLVYFLIIYFVHNIRDWQGLQQWRLYEGQGTGTLYGQVKLTNLLFGGYAFLRTLTSYTLGLEDRTSLFLAGATWLQRVAFVGYYALILVIVAVPVGVAFIKRRQLWQSYRWVLAVITTWMVLYSAFAFYWVPKDMEFWLPVLVAWWLLVGILLTLPRIEYPESVDKWLAHLPKLSFGLNTVVGIVLLFLIANAVMVVLPQHSLERNRSYWLAMNINQHTRQNDLIITLWHDWYISYFTDHRTISILELLLEPGSNKEAVFATLDQNIAGVQAQGGHVFLVDIPPAQDIQWGELQEEIGLTPTDMQHFKTAPAWKIQDQEVLLVLP